MSLLVLLISLLAPRTFGQRPENQQVKGTLVISLSDTRGLSLPPGTLSIKSSEGGVVYLAESQSQAVVHLPYGRYTVEFESNWFQPARRDIVIDRPDSFVVLAALFVAPEEKYSPGSVSVKVDLATPCNVESSLWAKLVGVYTQDVMEQRISPGGYALFEPVDRGAYIVIVVDGSKVRGLQSVVTRGETTVANLALSPCESK